MKIVLKRGNKGPFDVGNSNIQYDCNHMFVRR